MFARLGAHTGLGFKRLQWQLVQAELALSCFATQRAVHRRWDTTDRVVRGLRAHARMMALRYTHSHGEFGAGSVDRLREIRRELAFDDELATVGVSDSQRRRVQREPM